MDIDMKIKKRLDYCAIFQGQFFMFHKYLPLETYYSMYKYCRTLRPVS